MAKVGAWLIVVGIAVGAMSIALYIARQGELRNSGIEFDASPYVIWGGTAGVAVTCGTVLVAAAQVIAVLEPVDTPVRARRADTRTESRSHYE
jgi:hypothetical protein